MGSEGTCVANKRSKTSSSSSSSSSSLSSMKRCEDCGNKAKKDCKHNRCRTCCKNKGFQCDTHVKSTWVPVSQRQHQQRMIMHQIYSAHQHHNNGSSNPTTYRSQNPATPLGHFPGEVSFPAVFQCVRVNSVDNALEEYAYQASVNIGKTGILYDQGRPNNDETVNFMTGENLTAANFSQHQSFVIGSSRNNSYAATGNETQYPNSPCYAINNNSAASQFL